MELTAILAFVKALQPYLPLAMFGVQAAKDTLLWGLKALATMVEEERNPTEEEWLKVRGDRKLLLEKLNSDNI